MSPLPSPAGRNDAVETEPATRQDLYGAPVSMPFRGTSPAQPSAADDLPGRAESGGHGHSLPTGDQPVPPASAQGPQPPSGPAGPVGPASRGRSAPSDYSGRLRGAEEPPAYGTGSAQDQFRGESLDPHRGGVSPSPGPFRRPGGPSPAPPLAPAPTGPGSQTPQNPPARHGAPGPQGPPAPGAAVPQGPQGPQAYVPPQNGPYSGPQPAARRTVAVVSPGIADRRGAVGA